MSWDCGFSVGCAFPLAEQNQVSGSSLEVCSRGCKLEPEVLPRFMGRVVDRLGKLEGVCGMIAAGNGDTSK